MKQIPYLRWWISGLLAALITLSYIDRQSFPVAVIEITKQIPISNQAYGELQAIFLITYALMYAGGGKLIDWLGTRVGCAVIVLWWSAATFGQGLVHGLGSLEFARAMLGLGEGGGFPAAAKAVSEWFPPRERALAFGIFTIGASAGPTLAVPLVAGIMMVLDWRWVFFITGALGTVWLALWWWLYRRPEEHPRMQAAERSYVLDALAAERRARADNGTIAWIRLFSYRQFWGVIAPKFFTDAAWFFLIFWLPKYLTDERHLNLKQIAGFAWIPYAFSGLGCLAAGWLCARLIEHGTTLDRARKITLGIGAAIVPVSLLIAHSPVSLAIALFSLALFGHQFWSTILQTLAADIFPSSVVGSVAGLMGSVGAVGATLLNLLAGYLLSRYAAYPTLFAMIAVIYPGSWLIIWLTIRRIEPLSTRSQGADALAAS